MADSRFERLREIFDGALERSGAEREAYLREACGDDAELRREIDALLDAEAGLDDFLEPPQGFALPVEQLEQDAPHFLSEVEIGGYELIRELGRGGRGVVYLARKPGTDELVALKVLDSHMLPSAVAVERFRREARAVERLDHPGVVRIRRSGDDQGRPFLVMDFVAGRTLADELRVLRHRLDGAALPPHLRDAEPTLPLDEQERIRKSVDLVRQVAEALQHAHDREVLHRDVKPQNILLDDAGTAHLIDFGLAHLDEDLQLTRTGAVEGTPNYMSPEQVRAERERIDARTDVYSLGVVLYELLTLRRPFDAPTAERVMQNITRSVAPRLRKAVAGAPAALELVCATAMEKRRRDRYASAGAFAADLAGVLAGRPIQAKAPSPVQRVRRAVHRRPLPWSVAAGALVALGFGAWGADAWAQHERRNQVDTALRAGLVAAESGPDALDLPSILSQIEALPDGAASLSEAERTRWQRLRDHGRREAERLAIEALDPAGFEMITVSLGRSPLLLGEGGPEQRAGELRAAGERLGLDAAEREELVARVLEPRLDLKLTGAAWSEVAQVRYRPVREDGLALGASRPLAADLRPGSFPVPEGTPGVVRLEFADGRVREITALEVPHGHVRRLEVGVDRAEEWAWVSVPATTVDTLQLEPLAVNMIVDPTVSFDAVLVQEHPLSHEQFAAFAEAVDWPRDSWPNRVGLQRARALPRHPVTRLTQDEAAACAAWYGVRLPSFAEWQVSLRGAELPALPDGVDRATVLGAQEGLWSWLDPDAGPPAPEGETSLAMQDRWIRTCVPTIDRDAAVDRSAFGMRLGLVGVFEYTMTPVRYGQGRAETLHRCYIAGNPVGRPFKLGSDRLRTSADHAPFIDQPHIGFRCARPPEAAN